MADVPAEAEVPTAPVPADAAARPELFSRAFLALFAVDACASLAPRPRLATLAVSALFWLFGARAFADPPGRSASEDRRAQIARGLELRTSRPDGFTVGPCAFEHFALVAAYGAPERVTILPKRDVPIDPSCPTIAPRE